MRSPSWKISDMPPAMLPGAMPPMSAWCAMLQTKADERAVREHRHRHVDVGQMRAAGDERIVGDEQIAVVDLVLRILRQQRLHQAPHRGEVDRQRLMRLDDQPAARGP